MKSPLRAVKGEPILTDRAAHTFGTFRDAFSLRARLRGNGTLTLTEDRLVFTQENADAVMDIPLEDIQRVAVGSWHKSRTELVPVLKITYRGNLVFGVHVAHPDRWTSAIEEAAAWRGHAAEVDATMPPESFRHSRMLAVLLVVVLILSIGVPLLFSWTQDTTLPPPATHPPAENVLDGTGR